MDVARYGDYATLAYTNAKVQENYRRRFRITFPNEELPAARPLLTTPIYDRLTAANAVWGAIVRPRARAVVPGGRASSRRRRSPSGGRTPGTAWPRRSRAVRERVGMTEISNYAKYRVTGPGAEAWLSSLLTARMPAPGPDHPDRDAQRGRPDRRRVHGRPRRPRPTSSSCSARCRPRSTTRAGSATTCRPTAPSGSRCWAWGWSGCRSPGRASRDVLAAVAPDLDLSTEAFPFMTFRRVDLGMIAGARSARINYAGDLGYELWVAPEYQRDAVRPDRGRRRAARAAAVRDAGADVAPAREELRHVVPRVPADLHAARGRASRATSSSTTSSSGGRRTRPRSRRRAGAPAGRVRRRAGPGRPGRRHRRRADLARRRGRRLGDLGRLRPPRQGSRSRSGTCRPTLATPDGPGGAGFEIEIIGRRRPARLQPEPLFDPQGLRMRQ